VAGLTLLVLIISLPI